ncbi:hypothetical protein T492DRAFT_957853 [Pavlovales sp. CCMP2436]|nr:hypothetical protein T492DRAFT_957853 [Pavlovales sp. CCMP2436]
MMLARNHQLRAARVGSLAHVFWLAAALSLAGAARSLPRTPTYKALQSGQVHVEGNFIPPRLVRALREDAIALEAAGRFRASGLSEKAKGATQAFGAMDRRVCTLDLGLQGDQGARIEFATYLAALRKRVELATGRGPLKTAEQYLSAHGPGAILARHMDEFHEETKGSKGWMAPTRRSVSWLVYLSDEGWDEPGGAGAGGALRAYVRSGSRDAVTGGPAAGVACGAHEGNLQVGWRRTDRGGEEPVFLDCWLQAVSAAAAAAGSTSAIYRVCREGTEATRRQYLTLPFETASGADTDGGLFERQLLTSDERRRFSRVSAVPSDGQLYTDITPAGGTLALFDSVAVPHEVLPTTSGQRYAMAGWFHEAQQPFPTWFGDPTFGVED